MVMRHPLPLITLLAAAVSLAPPLTAQARGDAPGDPATPAGAIDDELLRQVDEAARLEREYRETREAAASRELEAREAARRSREREQRERGSADEAAYRARLSEQQAVQGDLLWALNGRGRPRPTGRRTEIPRPAVPGGELADPRVASPAPVERELPGEIFDTSRVEIAPGRWGNSEPIQAIRQLLDADGDGKPELVRYVERESGLLIRQEEDRNYDGVTDAWSSYEAGRIVSRILDGNDDGSPDVWERYRDGLLSSRELDRNDDGVKDVFYRYRGDSLSEEKHDADNDGVVDLIIVYRARLRVRAEEDVDRDGRMDTWTRYVSPAGVERIARIERDERGRGFADTFETFETVDGRAVLLRREEDLDGDGEIDLVSFYVDGKLRRRQISNPDAVPL